MNAVAGARVEEIQEAGRQVFETLVAQGPDRRPFDSADGSKGAGVGIAVVRPGSERRRYCVSLNSRTSFG